MEHDETPDVVTLLDLHLMDAVWSSLGTDDKRVLRQCCTVMPPPSNSATEQLLACASKGGVTIADYQAIASAAPWLTRLSMRSPASATALPQQMATLLSA
ncbi:hypothetical protein FOA52_010511 [Chlamydomonas sp. UWO 241]|nr:hypothetical protein FOA52_010511 [Chlamydomonas sp. UWO 241]